MVLAMPSGAMLVISGVLLAIGGTIVIMAMRQPGRRTGLTVDPKEWASRGEPAPVGAPAARAAPRRAASPRPVSLRAIVDRLVRVGDEETVHFDRRSGAFLTLGDQLRAAIESGDELDDPLEFTPEQLADMRRRMKAGEIVMLPTKAETREFELREQFIHELPEDGTKESMLKVMRGHAGFRSFDGAVKRLGLEHRWRALRDAAFAQIASDWCREQGIPFRADVAGSDEDEARPLRQAS